MEVIIGLDNIDTISPSVVTVGTFDGVHLGHRMIINSVLNIAKENDLVATLLTFEPHPKVVVQESAQEKIKILTNLEEKLNILKRLGLDRVIIAKFTREFSEIDHINFIKTILLQKLQTHYIIVGHDHGFGRNRSGNFRELEKLSQKQPFEVREVGPYKLLNQTVSSSAIRQLLENGEVKKASEMLGTYYSMHGIVVKGEGRGKKLSFPTANITVENHAKLMPKEGVYTVDCEVRGRKHRGMANIGYKPTFGGVHKTVEVHLFNFSDDIYGEKIILFFLQRLRKEKKFKSETELIQQLRIDKEHSYKI
jgi:riboflavin kinase/FMN adenylyltransferase